LRNVGRYNGEINTVLLIDDDEVDVMAFRRALSKSDVDITLTVAHNGEEALTFLRGDDDVERIATPYIILLDLNMPRMNGFEFLDEIRADAALKNSIVFVLTTSEAPNDLERAYDRHVAGYIRKSSGAGAAEDIVKLLDSYLKLVRLPEAG